MGQNLISCAALGGMAAAMLMPMAAIGQTSEDLDRVTTNEKGSLLMWSKYRLAWIDGYYEGDDEMLVEDTILQFTNDSPDAVDVQFYVVAPQLVEVPGEPGGGGSGGPTYEVVWQNFDIGITLTGNQPAWWSMATGNGTIAGMPAVGDQFEPMMPYGGLDGPQAVIHGYVYAWAVGVGEGSENIEITHNHLSGEARIIDYMEGYAWEYSAWSAARATDAGVGDATLNLDGDEYDTCFSHLLYNFYAAGDGSDGDPVAGSMFSNERLNLHIVDANLDADVPGAGSYKTKAHFDVWNEFEIKLSGQFRCIDCWDDTFISDYNYMDGGPNWLLKDNLGTVAGKARISSVSDTLLCEGNGVGGEYAMLGTASSGNAIYIDGVTAGDENVIVSGNNLIGMGVRSAVITYPLLDVPPVAPEGPAGAMDAFLRDIRKAAGSSK